MIPGSESSPSSSLPSLQDINNVSHLLLLTPSLFIIASALIFLAIGPAIHNSRHTHLSRVLCHCRDSIGSTLSLPIIALFLAFALAMNIYLDALRVEELMTQYKFCVRRRQPQRLQSTQP